MCTQEYLTYTCGCRVKRDFKQCRRLFDDAQSDLQCNETESQEVSSENYCPKHLPKEDKAKVEYRGRVRRAA